MSAGRLRAACDFAAVEPARFETGCVETGFVETGFVEAGFVETGCFEPVPLGRCVSAMSALAFPETAIFTLFLGDDTCILKLTVPRLQRNMREGSPSAVSELRRHVTRSEL